MKKLDKIYKLLIPIYLIGAIFMTFRHEWDVLLVWSGVAGLIVMLWELSKKSKK